MSISAHLIKWYQRNHRPMPWRETNDPYRIWLSEIILQQTRVEQGMPYYQCFIELYPTISDLANAAEDQVMKQWQGLGYYSRARNLHTTAKIVLGEYKGVFPSDYLHIRKLPGIGEYTASAIASFSFNQPYAVVDGNVSRVISRLFGITEPIDSSKGKKIIYRIASEILNKKEPASHNQAIMEFGAVVCKPALPDCENCFLQKHCEAYKLSVVSELPIKAKKIKIRERYFNYLLIRHKDSIFIRKRGPGDIWQNLFDLPLIETEQSISIDKIIATDEWKNILEGNSFHINSVTEKKVHKLSHQNIFTKVFDIRLYKNPGLILKNEFLKVMSQNAVNYAVPKVIENIFEEQLADYIKP